MQVCVDKLLKKIVNTCDGDEVIKDWCLLVETKVGVRWTLKLRGDLNAMAVDVSISDVVYKIRTAGHSKCRIAC